MCARMGCVTEHSNTSAKRRETSRWSPFLVDRVLRAPYNRSAPTSEDDLMRPLFVCALLVSLAAPALADRPKRPNVVLIMTDDMGYADLGCYGSKDIKTPHLDKLAKQGTRLTQF